MISFTFNRQINTVAYGTVNPDTPVDVTVEDAERFERAGWGVAAPKPPTPAKRVASRRARGGDD